MRERLKYRGHHRGNAETEKEEKKNERVRLKATENSDYLLLDERKRGARRVTTRPYHGKHLIIRTSVHDPSVPDLMRRQANIKRQRETGTIGGLPQQSEKELEEKERRQREEIEAIETHAKPQRKKARERLKEGEKEREEGEEEGDDIEIKERKREEEQRLELEIKREEKEGKKKRNERDANEEMKKKKKRTSSERLHRACLAFHFFRSISIPPSETTSTTKARCARSYDGIAR